MAATRYSFASNPNMSTGVGRNLLLTMLIFVVAGFAVFAAFQWGDRAVVTKLLTDSWIVQAVLVTAIVTLIYRLQSDIASLSGLQSIQRVRLDAMVRRKAVRLWSLFFCIAVCALLPRLLSAVTNSAWNTVLYSLAIFGSIASALYCLYLPGMWNELRSFLTALVAEREKRERQLKELERLSQIDAQ